MVFRRGERENETKKLKKQTKVVRRDVTYTQQYRTNVTHLGVMWAVVTKTLTF